MRFLPGDRVEKDGRVGTVSKVTLERKLTPEEDKTTIVYDVKFDDYPYTSKVDEALLKPHLILEHEEAINKVLNEVLIDIALKTRNREMFKDLVEGIG